MLLVVVAASTTGVLVAVASLALGRMASDSSYVFRYWLPPVEAIGRAAAHASEIERLSEELARGAPESVREHRAQLADELARFERRYENNWQVAGGATPDALRFRRDLRRAGATELLTEERAAAT